MTDKAERAKILIVDDVRDNLFVLENLLEHSGHEVLQACNGAEALTMATEHLPRLVLMDLDMPVMDGWEASRRIRAQPETAHIPIIAVSAHALLGDQERTLRDCCDGFITKPFAPQDILDRVKAALRRTERGAS